MPWFMPVSKTDWKNVVSSDTHSHFFVYIIVKIQKINTVMNFMSKT